MAALHGLYSYTFVAEAMYGNGCSMYMYGIHITLHGFNQH